VMCISNMARYGVYDRGSIPGSAVGTFIDIQNDYETQQTGVCLFS
jgi:hypothetical protein